LVFSSIYFGVAFFVSYLVHELVKSIELHRVKDIIKFSTDIGSRQIRENISCSIYEHKEKVATEMNARRALNKSDSGDSDFHMKSRVN
jgi:hypothetical protein